MMVTILGTDGNPELDRAGAPRKLHTLDALDAINAGHFVGIYETKQTGDTKKEMLVSVRPKTDADLEKERKERNRKIAELQAQNEAADKKKIKKVEEKTEVVEPEPEPKTAAEAPAEPAKKPATTRRRRKTVKK